MVVILLYIASTANGARQPSGGGTGGDLTNTLGRLLVLPAGSGDMEASSRACRNGDELAVASGGSCDYRLKTGFLGKRLRLRLESPGTVTVVLVQPDPRVEDTEKLDADHASLELTYKQDGSTLSLRCEAGKDQTCRVRVG